MRIPGLVSNEETIEILKKFLLLPLGANANFKSVKLKLLPIKSIVTKYFHSLNILKLNKKTWRPDNGYRTA